MDTENKIKLFLDADDVLLRSTEAVISILNKRYNLNANSEDVQDWNYTCVCPQTTEKEVQQIFASDEFWGKVQFDSQAMQVLSEIRDSVEIYIVSKGTKENLQKKKVFFDKSLHTDGFFGLCFGPDGQGFDKSAVNMLPSHKLSIQVDDRTDCLVGTNATLKILLKNGKEKLWNKYAGGETNWYVVNNWKEIGDIIKFYINNPDLLVEVNCDA